MGIANGEVLLMLERSPVRNLVVSSAIIDGCFKYGFGLFLKIETEGDILLAPWLSCLKLVG